jgi:hypothetical protein
VGLLIAICIFYVFAEMIYIATRQLAERVHLYHAGLMNEWDKREKEAGAVPFWLCFIYIDYFVYAAELAMNRATTIAETIPEDMPFNFYQLAVLVPSDFAVFDLKSLPLQ